MPKAKSPKGVEAAKEQDEGVTLPRLSLKETGFTGLKVRDGNIYQESQRAFQYPHLVKVVEEMRALPTVGASRNKYYSHFSRKKWRCVAPVGASDITVERAKLVESMMHDMQDSWASTISSIFPYMEYGFAILSIVPYRRLTRNGSRFNDGLVGLKKLANRNQDTIVKWDFSEDGRELLGVQQSIANLEDNYRYQSLKNENGLITIPRDSFLLFTSNGTAGNPQGTSIYKPIYLAAKQLLLLQDHQMLIAAREGKGRLKMEIPASYLDPENSPDNGATAKAFQTLAKNIDDGTAGTIILPQIIDTESKQKMFSCEYMENKGTSSVDLQKAIESKKQDIMQAMATEGMALGSSGEGSNALSSDKTTTLALLLDAKFREISDPLNKYLIPRIFSLNGWSQEELPYFEYYDDEDIDLGAFSQAVQRYAATGVVEVDRYLLNIVNKSLGIPERPLDEEVDFDKLSSNTSRSGDSMAVGKSGSGTSDIGSQTDSAKRDNSSANNSNK